MPSRGGVVPILQGGGENGKSAMTTFGILPALAEYAATASPKLIMGGKGEHSTERADLRGQRCLVAEELTEGRVLDVTALKQITDVGVIKARYVYRDNMSFFPSHRSWALMWMPQPHDQPFAFRRLRAAATYSPSKM